MDLHEAQQKGGGGGAPMGSPMEINNLKQQLQDTKKKLDQSEKQVEEKTKLCNDLENKLKVEIQMLYYKLDTNLIYRVFRVYQIFPGASYRDF